MSNTKKSFLVYYDLEDQVEEFTDEQVGKLFRAMLAYARRSEETEIHDSEVRAAFRFVKVSIQSGSSGNKDHHTGVQLYRRSTERYRCGR